MCAGIQFQGWVKRCHMRTSQQHILIGRDGRRFQQTNKAPASLAALLDEWSARLRAPHVSRSPCLIIKALLEELFARFVECAQQVWQQDHY